MVVDSDKLIASIDELNGHLTEGVVLVSFTKKDGTRRDMRCTKNMSMIPTEAHPKEKPPVAEGVIVKIPDPQLFKVFDLDVGEWRSFKYASIIVVRIEG